MGAAAQVALPAALAHAITERVVWLPHTYQAPTYLLGTHAMQAPHPLGTIANHPHHAGHTCGCLCLGWMRAVILQHAVILRLGCTCHCVPPMIGERPPASSPIRPARSRRDCTGFARTYPRSI